jgi:hypothetical protein
MILCSGLQSGGTSLISWCFLQRPDIDGVFDMENSVVQTDFSRVSDKTLWVKMTVGSFMTNEVMEIYQDIGFAVRPVLVIRDVRHAYASLIRKEYGKNGNTAEDPPLRLRYRRFLQDWILFRQNNWPILCYEKFVEEPEAQLHKLVDALNLPWDEAMLSWPKSPDLISYNSQGNMTFEQSRKNGTGLYEVLLPEKRHEPVGPINAADLDWLEHTFRSYNIENDYPLHLEDIVIAGDYPSVPSFEMTSRAVTLRRIEEQTRDYWEQKNKFDRIRNHIVFGPLLRLWATFVNRSFRQL